MRERLKWPAIIHSLRDIVPEAYIVGGAVRDAVRGRPLHDIDLMIEGDGIPAARRIANHLENARFHVLDSERGVGRAILMSDRITDRLEIDVAAMRGTLENDLRARDFTINAMAISLSGDMQTLIDPLGGQADLQAGILRACCDSAIASDPVRALRAARMMIENDLAIEAGTLEQVRDGEIGQTSVERVRDEFATILDHTEAAAALRHLRDWGLLAQVVPETAAMDGLEQNSHHAYDVLGHTFAVIENVGALETALRTGMGQGLIGQAAEGLADLRESLLVYLDAPQAQGRTTRALLAFAALMHDSGKPETLSTDEDGKRHFYGHETAGAKIAHARAKRLRLSNDEAAMVRRLILNHMRPMQLAALDRISKRAIYRFWRDTGADGMGNCLHSLADVLAKGTPDTAAWWPEAVGGVRVLLEAYIHRREQTLPEPLVDGGVIVNEIGVKPGPKIGRMLEALREAQAAGDVVTRADALDFLRERA